MLQNLCTILIFIIHWSFFPTLLFPCLTGCLSLPLLVLPVSLPCLFPISLTCPFPLLMPFSVRSSYFFWFICYSLNLYFFLIYFLFPLLIWVHFARVHLATLSLLIAYVCIYVSMYICTKLGGHPYFLINFFFLLWKAVQI